MNRDAIPQIMIIRGQPYPKENTALTDPYGSTRPLLTCSKTVPRDKLVGDVAAELRVEAGPVDRAVPMT